MTERDAEAVIAHLRRWLKTSSPHAQLPRADVDLLVGAFQRLTQSAQRLRRQNKRVRLKYGRLSGDALVDAGEEGAGPEGAGPGGGPDAGPADTAATP